MSLINRLLLSVTPFERFVRRKSVSYANANGVAYFSKPGVA